MQSQRSILAAGLTILLVIMAASIGLDLKSRSDAGWVEHTLGVLKKLSDVRLLVRRAESAARGHALIGDPRHLQEYQTALSQIEPEFAELKDRTRDNPEEAALLADTAALVARRLEVTSEGFRRHLAGDMAGVSQVVHGMAGRQLMDQVEANFDRLIAGEEALLAMRTANSRHARFVLLAIDFAGVVLVLLLATVLIREARRSSRLLETSLRATEAVNQTLEAAVDERAAHLLAAHEEVRNSAVILRSTFQSMAEGVLVIDAQGEVLLSNPAAERLLGYRRGMSAAELRAHNRVYHTDAVTELPAAERPADRALRGERFEGHEVVFRQPDRTDPLHLAISCRPLHDSAGFIKGAAMIYHDITASRETERKLLQAQKLDAIGKLTGGVAHDFNNMLTVITGTTEMLVGELKDRPELQNIAVLIDEAAERCSELIKHLLAFARQQPLQPRTVDINHTVLDLAKLLRPTLGEQIEIETVLQDDLALSHIDPSQLAHSLLNLAINARDAMPNGGRLTLETRNTRLDEADAPAQGDIRPGFYVEIIVCDSGSGMPADIRDKVFEPFFTTKAPGKGSGLGLSMVYGFVKQSGGHIKIASEPGQGTTIRLYLPLARAPAEQLDRAGAPRLAGGNETILIVEDDVMVRNFVTIQLVREAIEGQAKAS